MEGNIPQVHNDIKIKQAKLLLQNYCLSFVPIIDDEGTVYSYCWISDLLNAKDEAPIAEIERHDFLCVDQEEQIEAIFENICESIDCCPIMVVDNSRSLVGVIRDIDILKVYKKTCTFYKNTLETLNKAIMVVNGYGYINYTSGKWQEIHRLSGIEGEYVGKRFPESQMLEVLQKDDFEIKNKISFSATGATVLPAYKKIKDEKGNTVGALVIIENNTDNTDFRFVTQSIYSIGNYVSVIFDSLNDGILISDKHHRIAYTNNALKTMLNLSIEGNGSLDSDYPLFKDIVKNVEKDARYNESIKISDEKLDKHFSVARIPIVNYIDELQGIVCIIKDITLESNLGNEINKKNSLIEFLSDKLLGDTKDQVIAESEKSRKLLNKAIKVAPSDISVLITGESGVGKEVMAKIIHVASNRGDKPFVSVNCGAIPESLWESEMFGYEEGAFTGSKKGGKPGKFEIANGGVLFLDEIGEMPLNMQVKMLRVLESMEVERIGSNIVQKIDVRIISATNKDIKGLIAQGKFREDLYYRLNIVELHIPPLRERKDDIYCAIRHFLNKYNNAHGKNLKIKVSTIELLESYCWHGNMRELKNAIHHGVIMAEGAYIEIEHLPNNIAEYFDSECKADTLILSDAVQEAERETIMRALEEANNNKTLAMEKLKISRRTFYKKLKDLNIS